MRERLVNETKPLSRGSIGYAQSTVTIWFTGEEKGEEGERREY